MMGLAGLLLFGAIALAAALAVGALVIARSRDRANRVVPELGTTAPSSWAGAHTPEARLHRRLRDAVVAVRSVADPDGALIAARVEVERAAVAMDEHLIALAALPERERAGRLGAAEAGVASVEHAAAQMADARRMSASGALPATEAALERAHLVAEARAELDADPVNLVLGADEPLPPPRTPSRGHVEIVPDPATTPEPAPEDQSGPGTPMPG